jgi:hypothetical protein
MPVLSNFDQPTTVFSSDYYANVSLIGNKEQKKPENRRFGRLTRKIRHG